MMRKKILDVFHGNIQKVPPLWLMRQAGRYLPEYKEVRKKHKNFIQFCYTKEAATEVTLQPLRRFDFDAAILFSDILVIPEALGQQVSFQEQKGPILADIDIFSQLKPFSETAFLHHLSPVFQTIESIRQNLNEKKALIGFSGAPWTLACYMIEKQSSKDFSLTKTTSYQNPSAFQNLIDVLVKAISCYLVEQIKHGAEIIQIFDSWAGIVSNQYYKKWCVEPIKAICDHIKNIYPHIPIIVFSKTASPVLAAFNEVDSINGLSLDTSICLAWAHNHFRKDLVLQGNLDPFILRAGGAPLEAAIETIYTYTQKRPWIFNLGHGIDKDTPIPHVEFLVKKIKSYA